MKSDLYTKFVSALLTSKDLDSLLKMGDVQSLFEHTPMEGEDFTFIQDFVRKYGKLPNVSTYVEHSGRKLKKTSESVMFYYDELMQRHLKKTMIKSSQEATELLKNGDIEDAFTLLRESLERANIQKSGITITDLRKSHDLLQKEILDKNKPDYGIKTGWPYFDDQTGGLRGSDLVGIVGRPGLGKTQILLTIALNAWRKQQKRVAFFSMEMSTIQLIERTTAMEQHIPYNWVKRGQFSNLRVDTKKKFLDGVLSLDTDRLKPFDILDANMAADIDEVLGLSRQLRPDLICVDGAYLIKSSVGYGRGDRITHVCNSLKKLASTLNVPVVATWQFSRESTKLKKGETAGLEHIGDSDSIGRDSSIVLGLFQEETAQTIKQREIRMVKGRSGEEGSWNINWNWNKMDFSQIDEIQDFEVMIT